MADSIRELVLAAFADLLAEAVPIEGGVRLLPVFRLPAGGLSAGDVPALVLLEGDENLLESQTSVYHLSLDVTVVVVIEAQELGADDDPDFLGAGNSRLSSELNRLRSLVRNKVAEDPILGGVALWTRYDGADAPVVNEEPGGAPLAALPLRFVLEYQESESDSTAFV